MIAHCVEHGMIIRFQFWTRGYKTREHVFASSQLLRFILSLRMNSSFITLRPVVDSLFVVAPIVGICFVMQFSVSFLALQSP